MKTINKNIQKLGYGVAVAALAITFSSAQVGAVSTSVGTVTEIDSHVGTEEYDTPTTTTTEAPASVPDTGFFTGSTDGSVVTLLTTVIITAFFAGGFFFVRSKLHTGPARRYVRK